ncbi:Fur family transcriptional regulator [Hydrogenophaga sp.]|jgi:Fur family ferric uptake transcriptional regulator|uniref:Fur family transcriptional regulator n=1 Tax=Hydrogenophaga sp. TaxID=1904254 RepID=UPI003F6EC763
MSSRLARELTGVPPEVQSRLERAGLRRTLATRAVLGLFLTRPRSRLTHAQAQAALTARGLDLNRVTLYRLLDRLAVCGVLRREADEQRIWRFSLAPTGDTLAETDGAGPRFECDTCHRRFELSDAGEPTRAVTRDLFEALARLGHQGRRLDVSIHGTCASCVTPNDLAEGIA